MLQDILLIGDNHLTRRLRRLLGPAGHAVLITEEEALPAGRFTTIVVATDQDDYNLHLALAALEQFPGVRLVVRIDSPALARGLQERLPDAIILCPPELAASSFAAATVHPSLQGAMILQDRLHVLWETTDPPPGAQVLLHDPAGLHLVLAPWDDVREWLAKGAPDVEPPPPAAVPAAYGTVKPWRLDAVVVTAFAMLCSLLFFGTAFFSQFKDLSLIDAFYFTATTIATVGYGDISLHGSGIGTKLVGVGMMFAGVVSLAVMTALVTDQVFRRRQAMLRGHRRSRLQGHVVLCGLGRLGAGILAMLDRMGQQVVAIEPAPDPVVAYTIQQGGIHLIEADATHPESLEYANVRRARARALVAATDNDLANIQIALTAVSIHPAVRLVLRIFTPELARRSQAFLGFGRSMNAWRLAAEAFAAAILEDDRVCLVAEWHGKTIELVHQGDGAVGIRRD